jgi:hypothetical protein
MAIPGYVTRIAGTSEAATVGYFLVRNHHRQMVDGVIGGCCLHSLDELASKSGFVAS